MAKKIKSQMTEARFALIFEGEDLPMTKISTLVGLEPTREIHKGDVLNRRPEILAEEDEWIHVIQLDSPLGEDGALNALLEKLAQHPDALRQASELGRVTLRIHVESDYAQMAYRLMPETLHRLDEIGLPLEVTSLSWGEVGI